MKTREQLIKESEQKIAGYKEALKLMPEDTFLGRVCLEAYLKKEKKRLDKLLSE